MSQSPKRKYQKITIRNRPGMEDSLTTGGNVEVLLDGERIRGAQFVKVEISCRKISKVTIELLAEVEVETNFTSPETEVEEMDLITSKGKPIYRHTLSYYSPRA